MSLELVNTTGTLLTTVIVGATAIAALVQLRHLSAGNQINAMLAVGEVIQTPSFVAARDKLRRHMSAAMEDPSFRDYVVAYNRNQPLPGIRAEDLELHHGALLVGNKYEELGIMVKNGIINKQMFLDRFNYVISGDWKRLEPLNSFAREVSGNMGIWENFEYLAVLSEDWMKQHPSSYPIGTRRMQNTNRWTVPPAASTT